MAATAIEKILARVIGRTDIKPGEIIYPEPDVVIMHDGHAHKFLRELWDMGVKKLWHPERIMIAMDHRVPALNPSIAQSHADTRHFVKTYGIKNFFDIGNSGITHQLQIERGFARPGAFIVTRDGHSPTGGAVGCLAISIGQDILPYLALGNSWLRVPETLHMILSGQPGPGVLPRDVAQTCTKFIGPEQADNRVIEFSGEYVDSLEIDGRQVLCNIMVEIDAVSSFINPDMKCIDYVRARTDQPFTPVTSDKDAAYAETLELDVSTLEPIVAAPPEPNNVMPISFVAGKPIHQIFIGTCAGGHLDDIRAAASVMKGRHVASGVRALIAPATQRILEQATQEGLINTLIQAGATIMAPGCAACSGSTGPLADGERCITTATSNKPGRMGSKDAEIYIANALTVAASAIAGKIVDPKKVLGS